MAFAAVTFIFLLGIGNFALHKAAMESRSGLLQQVSWLAHRNGKRIAFVIEFVVLVAAMLLAANGWPGIAWGYLIYTLLNAVSAWLILNDRI